MGNAAAASPESSIATWELPFPAEVGQQEYRNETRPKRLSVKDDTKTLYTTANPYSTAQIAGHPIHPMLVPIPIVCFIGALVTDIIYAASGEIMWADFSTWLLIVGLIGGVLAGIAGVADLLSNRHIRARPPAWPHGIGNIVVLVLSFFNLLVHTRDAWTSVVPTGLILSIIVVLILPVTGWLGWSMVYRYGVGVLR